MRILLTSFLLFLASALLAQPYFIGNTNITFFDASRNRDIPCELHYPADVTGTDMDASDGAYPLLVIGHGFVMSVDAYTYLWQHYVPLGYIVALPTTEGGLAPDHADFGADLAFVADAIQGANMDGASLFFGHVAPATALMGHSMGGGAAFLGAAANASIQTLVTFAPAETTPSAVAAGAEVLVPSLVFAASEDCVTPIADHAQPMYDALSVDCKVFVDITGGGHCYFGDPNALCSFGELTCAPALAITRAQQQDVVTDLTDLWLDHQLNGSPTALNNLLDSLTISTRYQSLSACLSTAVTERTPATFTAFWHAQDGNLVLNGLDAGAEVSVTNAWGQLVARAYVSSNNMVLGMAGRAAGLYYVRQCATGICTTRPVVLRY